MKHLGAIAVVLITTSVGCVLPCRDGACSSGSFFSPPMARYFGTETVCNAETGNCSPKSYVTFTKYWPFLDDIHTTWTAKSCAKKILYRQQWSTKRILSSDYKDGFTQAFVDIANGSNGEVPAVPPPKFWNTHFRSGWGQRKAERWFDGYRSGAAMAAVEFEQLRRVAASADWTIEKPDHPFVSQAACAPSGCQSCQPAGGILNPQGSPFCSQCAVPSTNRPCRFPPAPQPSFGGAASGMAQQSPGPNSFQSSVGLVHRSPSAAHMAPNQLQRFSAPDRNGRLDPSMSRSPNSSIAVPTIPVPASPGVGSPGSGVRMGPGHSAAGQGRAQNSMRRVQPKLIPGPGHSSPSPSQPDGIVY